MNSKEAIVVCRGWVIKEYKTKSDIAIPMIVCEDMASLTSHNNKSVLKSSRRVPVHGFNLEEKVPLGFLNHAVTDKLKAVHSYIAVAAIDFGTTYSGYAYAFTTDPSNIHVMDQRLAGHRSSGYGTQQPTALLLTDEREFHSFGYEAQEYYHDMDENESMSWLYFEKFKMELHTRKHLHEGMELVAANGFKFPAVLIFAHALNYFKCMCMREIREQSTNYITANEIQWVITVPAIWRHSARQFMRRAAIKAGLISTSNPSQLIIALEPEAASVYCKTLQLKNCIVPKQYILPGSTPSPSTGAPRYSSSSLSGESTDHSGYSTPELTDITKCAADIHPGVRYLVADCGGGTVDLTVHHVEKNGQLKELYKASGGACGSIGVDCEFEMLLVSIFGEIFIEEFIKSHPISWLELMKSFEAKKRSFDPARKHPSNISLPYAFIDTFHKTTRRTVKHAVISYGDANIQWSTQGMLRILPEVMMRLFEPVIKTIVKYIHKVITHPDVGKIEYAFLVGGFSESPVLQKALHSEFDDKLHIIIPQDVSLCILKGAVMFGIDPSLVRIRRSAATYGVACLNKYDPMNHPARKKVVKDGNEWCTDIFDTFVHSNQSISHGYCITRCYNPARSDIKSTVITLFASDRQSVKFITDPGVWKLGELRLEMPDITEGRNRELRMTMIFGDTEISVKAVDCSSGQTASAHINFLYKQ